ISRSVRVVVSLQSHPLLGTRHQASWWAGGFAMLLAWRPSDDASAIASCASKVVPLTGPIVFTMNSAPKTMAGIQKTKIPFQAKGPDLKNGKMIAGVNMIATQMLKYAIHLGKSGVGRGSERIAKANAKYCAMNGGHGITRMIQL